MALAVEGADFANATLHRGTGSQRSTWKIMPEIAEFDPARQR